MDLQLETLDPLEAPTAEQFWAGFVQGATIAATGVAVLVAIYT